MRFYRIFLAVFALQFPFFPSAAIAGNDRGSHPAFIENRGQLSNTVGAECTEVKFYSLTPGANIYLLNDRLSIVFRETEFIPPLPGKKRFPGSCENKIRTHRVDMIWLNGGENITFSPVSSGTTFRNYYGPGNPGGLLRIPEWKRISISGIYPLIDLEVYFHNGKLKYDFIVHPGGNPDQIRLGFSGADEIQLMENGTLYLKTSIGEFTEGNPLSFQGENQIECNYILESGVVSFQTGYYDPSQTLLIDPLREWATYFGGSQYEFIHKMECGPSGDLYLCGMTTSPNFPVSPGAWQSTIGAPGMDDMFLSRFSPDGNLVWSTYYGGSSSDQSSDISVNEWEEIHVLGTSISSNFPFTWGAFSGGCEIVILHFDSTGTRINATMFGGTADDYAWGISAIPGGGTYLCGETNSANYPVSWGSAQVAKSVGSDMFITQLDIGGSITWSTFFGGSGYEYSTDIATGSNKNAIICGKTNSADFPTTTGCFQSALSGIDDGIVAVFDSNGMVQWATFFGGTDSEDAWSIDVDDSSRIYLGGETFSADLPSTTGTLSDSLQGSSDFMIARFDPAGTLDWCGYLGGEGEDGLYDLRWDKLGQFHATGWTTSAGFPVTANASQDSLAGNYDTPLVTINPDGEIIYATYCGGSNYDAAYALASDGNGALYIAGETGSLDFPADTNAFQVAAAGNWDGWIAKFDFCDSLAYSTSMTDEICNGSNGSAFVFFTGGTSPVTITWSTGDTTASLLNIPAGNYSVVIRDSIGCRRTGQVQVISYSYFPYLNLGPDTAICNNDSLLLVAGSGFSNIQWSNMSSGQTMIAPGAGNYSVSVTDSNNCTAADSILISESGPSPDFSGTASGLAVQFTDLSMGLAAWYWDFGDGNSSGQSSPLHSYSSAGPYLVCLTGTDSAGCTGKKCVMTVLLPAGIETSGVGFVKVYPNPADDYLVLESDFPSKGIVEWAIFDLTGKSIQRGKIHPGTDRKVMIRVDSLEQGMYLFKAGEVDGILIAVLH